MILHKADCNGSLVNRSQYLVPLNKAYDEKFENLDQYKHKDNFKRILKKLSLEQVGDAVRRLKALMQRNTEMGFVLHQYKGYEYYKENPALSLWEIIEKILNDCELL